MAALSFSPSPPPTTTATAAATAATATAQQRNGNQSKENCNATTTNCHIKPLGASKPFQKMTVHNVLSESGANALQQQHFSNQNTIIRKIKDFGMLGSMHNATAATTPATPATAATATGTAVARKRPLAKCNNNSASAPQQSSSKTPTLAKRSKPSKKTLQQQQEKQQQLTLRQQEQLECSNRPAGTPGRKGLPLPQAVARRNARERNRVKQVNNGFAALRERIPDEVSEAFEAQGAGRGASKKLSKVETLRMAVEYIRSLERLLGFDFPPLGGCSNSNSSSSGDDSFMFVKDEFDGLDDEPFDDSLSNYELDAAPTQQAEEEGTELLPSVTTLNGLQYVRIPGTSTYQLLTPDMLAAVGSQDSSSLDEEQFNALIDTNCLSSGVAAAPAAPSNGECVKFASTLSRSPQQQQLIKQEYSEGDFRQVGNNNHNSNSPPAISNNFQQQQQQQQLLCSPVLPAFYDQEPATSFYDNVVVGLPSFKKEFTDVLHDQSTNTAGGCLSDESMIDAIDWWEAHTPKSDAGTVGGL
ncbi:hypothetical protein KR093_005236 [Drosophila rubida]|uniref:BHLH domain-containing protein n=1 Tax=Drosophila rubida TaxID=30044 RepID=A0AAD4PQU2_9MUSC|nr:hypothetical protein KR093_005236 [Drosophila rubida]